MKTLKKNFLRTVFVIAGISLVAPLSIVAVAAGTKEVTIAQYEAYRTVSRISEESWARLKQELPALGIKHAQSASLDQQQILVLVGPLGTATLENLEVLLEGMIQIPVNVYTDRYGAIFTVSTGNFLVRFDDSVSPEEARKRIENLGFEVMSAEIETEGLILVAGSRIPVNQELELVKLKTLENLLYVASDDLPIKEGIGEPTR